MLTNVKRSQHNLKIIFDGETRELKSVEVRK